MLQNLYFLTFFTLATTVSGSYSGLNSSSFFAKGTENRQNNYLLSQGITDPNLVFKKESAHMEAGVVGFWHPGRSLGPDSIHPSIGHDLTTSEGIALRAPASKDAERTQEGK